MNRTTRIYRTMKRGCQNNDGAVLTTLVSFIVFLVSCILGVATAIEGQYNFFNHAILIGVSVILLVPAYFDGKRVNK